MRGPFAVQKLGTVKSISPRVAELAGRIRVSLSRLGSSASLVGARGFAFAFLVGFFVRLVPELLAYPHPIGFDTVYYAWRIESGVVLSHWSQLFTSSWLFYGIFVPIQGLLQVDPFLLLKLAAPLLFGLNTFGIYYFARKMLGWSPRLSMLASGFFALQLASLRISWDLLRNTLGLGLLLCTLPLIRQLKFKRGVAAFVLLSLLTVFAHEYAAVILMVVILGLAVSLYLKDGLKRFYVRKTLAVLPAVSVFLVSICLRVFPIHYAVDTNILSSGDVIAAHPMGLPFFVDYLGVKSLVDYYPTYWTLVLSVVVLFCFLYLPYLYLIRKGFFRDRVLTFWTGVLIVGAFGCLAVPFFAPQYWHRWLFMLVYPFTFYAANGLKVIYKSLSLGDSQLRVSRKVKGAVLVTALLGCSYLATPVLMANLDVSPPSFPVVNAYFSTSPTVPYQDVDSVVQAMQWLESNMNVGSCVILQHAFVYWGKLHLTDSQMITRFEIDVDAAVDTASNNGFRSIFFVWWNQDIGWYGLTVPEGFIELEDFGRISIYEYGGI